MSCWMSHKWPPGSGDLTKTGLYIEKNLTLEYIRCEIKGLSERKDGAVGGEVKDQEVPESI